jgi:hypothetical protein
MSAEKSKIFRLAILGVSLPVALGIVIELACDLLKHVIRYFTTSIYFDLQHDIWVGLKAGSQNGPYSASQRSYSQSVRTRCRQPSFVRCARPGAERTSGC